MNKCRSLKERGMNHQEANSGKIGVVDISLSVYLGLIFLMTGLNRHKHLANMCRSGTLQMTKE